MDDSLEMLGLAEAHGGSVAPECRRFNDDGRIPNSPLPTLLFRSHGVAGALDREAIAACFERLFCANGWQPSWRGGVYDYHHYHSIAHETFGVLSGRSRLRLGGERGEDFTLEVGDVLVLPAGTGHCHLEASEDFLLLAAYPEDQRQLDLIGADPEAHDAAVARIAQVSLPPRDPLGGDSARWWG